MLKLSIIIPVYNASKYLNTCLNSIVNQDLSIDQYEIILINDGSTDTSRDIVLDFKNSYDNIIFIEQENQGVSVARNKGLAIAKGKYITFIDADDSIHSNTLKKIINNAENNKLDVLYLSIDLYSQKGVFLSKVDNNLDESIIAPGWTYPRRTFAATLYLKELIADTRFSKLISFGEDTLFNAMVHSKAKRCSYYSLAYYKYRTHDDSQTKSTNTTKLFSGFIHAIKIINDYKNNNYPKASKQIQDYFDKITYIFLERILQLNITKHPDRKQFTIVKELFQELNLNYLIDKISKDYRCFNKRYLIFFLCLRLKEVYYSLLTIGSTIKRKIYA